MSNVLIFIFGLSVGSFLNVLILRIPQGQTIRGRSRCLSCERSLRWFELVPLLSYVVLRGKCRSCRVGISLQYPFVEFATAFLFLFIVLTYAPDWLRVTRYALLVTPLIVLFVQDLRFQILPDIITLPAIALALIFVFVDSNYSLLVTRYSLLAATVGSLFFLVQWLISRGRWVGGGDIRLGALAGAIVGWPNILLMLFLAYISGAAVGLVLMALGRVTRKSQMAFGTFLAASTVFTMFWGDAIVSWYTKAIGL